VIAWKWLEPWEASPTTLIAFAVFGVLYVRGASKRRVSGLRQLGFWFGFALLYVALHTRLDYYSEHEFFVHRLQHLVLHHLGPFLIALSHPAPALRAGVPLIWRVHTLRPIERSPPVRWLFALLINPVVAPLLFVGLIYFWLWPPMHFEAMLDVRLYRIMNWSMAIDGLMFWWLIVDRRPRPPARVAPGLRVFLPLLVMLPQIVLGAYVTFTHRDLYPVYALCGRAFGTIAPSTDQSLGGLITWIPSSMMSVVAALIAMRNWLFVDVQRHRKAVRVAASHSIRQIMCQPPFSRTERQEGS
jgi:putative membrane protein